MKRKINKKFIIGTTLGLTLSAGFVSVFAATNFSHSQSIQNNSFAPQTFSSLSLISPEAKKYVTSAKSQSAYTIKGNKIIAYSKNAIEEFSITLEKDTRIAAIETFEVADMTYLAAITSRNKLLVYDIKNPAVVAKSFDIHQNLNALSKNENYLYLYSAQNSLSSFTAYQKLNLKTFELEAVMPPSLANVNSQFVSNIVNILPNVNVLIYLTLNSFALQNVTSTTTFRSANYIFVDDNLQPLTNGVNQPNQQIDFPQPLNFAQINTFGKKNNKNFESASDIAAFVSLGSKILLIKNSLATEIIATPENKIIHSVIFNDHLMKVILKGDNSIYSVNPVTGLFFVNQDLPNTGDPIVPTNYNLMDLDENDAYVVAVEKVNQTTAFYGISPDTFVELNDVVDFAVSVKAKSYRINSDTPIPLLASSLTLNSLEIINLTSANPYILVGELDFLELVVDAEKNNSTAKVSIGLAASSWYDNSKSVITKKVLDINNFFGLKQMSQASWIDETSFNNAINISLQQVSPNYLKTVIKPLNIEEWSNNVFKVEEIDYFIESINPSGDLLTISAFVKYLNLIDNSFSSIKVSKSYLVDISTEKIFQLYGDEEADGTIDIATVIAQSSGKVDQSIRNFMPSYVFRSSSLNLAPTVEDLESFYLRFIKNVSNVLVSVVADSNDDEGTLTLTFNLDQSVNDRKGEFSSKQVKYVGLKKITDFNVNFANAKSNDDRVDYTKIEGLNEAQKNLSSYSLVTGNDLRTLLYSTSPIATKPDPKKAAQAQRNMEALLSTNLNLMKFSPVFELQTSKTKEDLLKSIVEGTLDLKVSYPNITETLRQSLGLDENFSKKVTFYNLPKIDDLFNFKFDEELSQEIIDAYETGEELTVEIKKQILKAIESLGYKKDDATYEMKWDNDVIKITITPKDNNLNGELGILPKTYNLELSWYNKNFPAYLTKVLLISIPTTIFAIALIVFSIIVWIRKTHLRKYF